MLIEQDPGNVCLIVFVLLEHWFMIRHTESGFLCLINHFKSCNVGAKMILGVVIYFCFWIILFLSLLFKLTINNPSPRLVLTVELTEWTAGLQPSGLRRSLATRCWCLFIRCFLMCWPTPTSPSHMPHSSSWTSVTMLRSQRVIHTAPSWEIGTTSSSAWVSRCPEFWDFQPVWL